ncbi:hypothetical protein K1I64_04875, partial [Streptococcus mitis]|nr:hypothetical protein [Streptococcus mitis]MBZ2114432.1 hypothetical protein [Streptococcus mitis]
MGLFFYTKIGSIIFIGDLPTTNIIEPEEKGLAGLLSLFASHTLRKSLQTTSASPCRRSGY